MFADATEASEKLIDDVIFKIRKKLKWNSPVVIIPYRSYGTRTNIYITGRVLENKLIKPSDDKESSFKNLSNMYKRFQSNEVPKVTLEVVYHDKTYQIITDNEGYFTLNFSPVGQPNIHTLWHPVTLRIKYSPIPWEDQEYIAEVLVPPVDAEYGIISDIDDTVIQTSATKFLAMAKTVFLNNAHSRLPFPGVSAFYNALLLGKNGKRNNPFFYVSSSPWNMYDLLKEFLDLNKIPEGPLLLRDIGLQDNKIINKGHQAHKTKEIVNILKMYPNLNFVLIGDSGQQDAFIYNDIATLYPDRILAIYIRDLGIKMSSRKINDLIAISKKENIQITLTKNAEQAAKHAAEKGLIFVEAIADIEIDKKQDEGELPGKEVDSVV